MKETLVTGAAGKTGRAVISALSDRGAPVRAFIRGSDQAERVRSAGAQSVVVGDLLREADLVAAAEGASAIYHMAPNMHPDEIAIGRHAIAAGQAAGVSHFVYHSVLHPQTEKMPHHWHKLRVEEILFESGLPFTILQPTVYMQNILANWRAISERGDYPVPYPVETRLSLVDLADVAQVAARVLTEDGYLGATYELAGTLPLSQTQVAARLSRALDRPVAAREVPLIRWKEDAEKSGALSRYAIETLLAMFRYYARHGLVGNPTVLGYLLGRKPTAFETLIERVIAESQ